MAIPLYIGNSYEGSDKAAYDVFNPLSRKVVHRVASANQNDLETAIAVAHSAFPAWSSRSLQERAGIVRKAAALLKDHRSGWKEKMRIANLEETSVPPWWAGIQVGDVVGFLEALADGVEEALAPWIVSSSASMYRRSNFALLSTYPSDDLYDQGALRSLFSHGGLECGESSPIISKRNAVTHRYRSQC